MFNLFLRWFDAMFPLKDDPKRAMQQVFDESMKIAQQLTVLLADERDQEGLAYQLFNRVNQFYTEEIDDTMMGIGFIPNLMTEKDITANQPQIIKELFLFLCEENNFFFCLEANNGREFFNELLELLDRLSEDSLIEKVLELKSDHKLINDCPKAIESTQKILLAEGFTLIGVIDNSVRKEWHTIQAGEPIENLIHPALIAVCKSEQSDNLKLLKETHQIDTAIEAIMHPYYLSKLPKKSHSKMHKYANQYAAQDRTELNAIENQALNDNLLAKSRFNPTQDDNPFIKDSRQAFHTFLRALLLNQLDKDYLEKELDTFEEELFESIHQDFLAYLLSREDLAGFQSFNHINQIMYQDYLNTLNAQMIVSNALMDIKLCIRVEPYDTGVLVYGLSERLNALNLEYPPIMQSYFEEEDEVAWLEKQDYSEVYRQIEEYLNQQGYTMLSMMSSDESILYAMIKQSDEAELKQLAERALIIFVEPFY